MANIASNRSPSPCSSRISRNSEANSTTRRSFNGNPFSRPTALTNPRSINPVTPANSPAITDLTKRLSTSRKSIGNSSSMFQDGKENNKDSIRSPAKSGSKNFMTPTISAASKFTPSPRKKVLGEKNEELARTSIQFLNRDSDLDQLKEKKVTFETNPVHEVITLNSKNDLSEMLSGVTENSDSDQLKEKKVTFETNPVHEVITLNSKNDLSEMLSGVTENSDFVNVVESSPKIIRPFCCSPMSSPIIAPIDDDTSVLPYDPKKNFLSPRPQFLRYKPNPRIDVLLNKLEVDDDCKDDSVTGFDLDDSFNLSENENSSDTEKEEEDDVVDDSMESSVLEEKTDSNINKVSKSPFFTRSKMISLLSLMFLIFCFSVSFTDSPPMDLPIYKDVSFSEIYHESLRFVSFAKQSLDDFVESLENLSVNLVSYLSNSHFSSSDRKISSIQFFNLTISPPQDEFLFEEIQEFEEETEVFEEKFYELEVVDDSNEEDDVETEELSEMLQPHESIQSKNDDSDSLKTNFDLEDGSTEVEPEANLEIGSTLSDSVVEVSSEAIAHSEMVKNDLEIHSVLEDSSEMISESDALISLLTKSIVTISMAGFSLLIMAASIVIYKKSKTRAEPIQQLSNINERRESCSSGTSSVYKKKPRTSGNKRESMASSSSDFSMGSGSYGSFTTFERIPIKKGDEEMLTPIRRSSRLMKNQATS